MERYKCLLCGREFDGYPSQRRVYCSTECRIAAGVSRKKKTGWYQPCAECGKQFWVVPAREATARYCSRACKDKVKLLATHTCVECGQEFEAWPSSRRLYCSPECATKHKTFREGGACEQCGKALDPKRGQHRFCSLTCANQAARTGQEVPCAMCGTQVYRPAYDLRQSKEVFCSVECKDEGQRLQGPGSVYKAGSGYEYRYYPKHPDASTSGLIAEHRWVAEQKIGRRLRANEHVHHINGVRDDNRPENLEIISPSAHARLTSKAATEKRRSEKAELEEYRRRYGPLQKE